MNISLKTGKVRDKNKIYNPFLHKHYASVTTPIIRDSSRCISPSLIHIHSGHILRASTSCSSLLANKLFNKKKYF